MSIRKVKKMTRQDINNLIEATVGQVYRAECYYSEANRYLQEVLGYEGMYTLDTHQSFFDYEGVGFLLSRVHTTMIVLPIGVTPEKLDESWGMLLTPEEVGYAIDFMMNNGKLLECR